MILTELSSENVSLGALSTLFLSRRQAKQLVGPQVELSNSGASRLRRELELVDQSDFCIKVQLQRVTLFGGPGGHSTVVSLLASRSSCPGFDLEGFLEKKIIDVAELIYSSALLRARMATAKSSKAD